MLIACPSCAKRYDITAHPLPGEGRRMRCASCGHNWLATPAEAFMPQPRPYPPRPAPRIIDEDPRAMASSPRAEPMDEWDDDPLAAKDSNSQGDIDALFGDTGGDSEPAEGAGALDVASTDEPHPVLARNEPGELQPIEDAAFEELDSHSAVARVIAPPAEKPRGGETLSDVEAMANRRADVRAKVRARRSRPRHSLTFAASLALLAALATFREATVQLVPQTAPVYAALGWPVNLTGLDFANVTFLRSVENGVETLLISGEIRNVSEDEREVPALRLVLQDLSNAPLYEWVKQIDTERLAPGGSATFETRLTSPPADASEVVLRFAPREGFRLGML